MEGKRSDQPECPGCGSSSFSVEADGRLVCDYCQTAYWEVLDAVFARATGGSTHWLRQTREEAAAVKAQEEAASQKRLAEMWAIEQRRREELARAQAERDRQMRILWYAAVVFFGIVVTIVIIIALLKSPHPYFP